MLHVQKVYTSYHCSYTMVVYVNFLYTFKSPIYNDSASLGYISQVSNHKVFIHIPGNMFKLKFFDFISTICALTISMLCLVNKKLQTDISITANTLNNTKNANQGILIYNRVPKSGSKNMLLLIEQLQTENMFQSLADADAGNGQREVNIMTFAEKSGYIHQFEVEQDNRSMPYSFTKHMNFLDFEEFNKTNPIYINIVRNPIERVISWYYYIR